MKTDRPAMAYRFLKRLKCASVLAILPLLILTACKTYTDARIYGKWQNNANRGLEFRPDGTWGDLTETIGKFRYVDRELILLHFHGGKMQVRIRVEGDKLQFLDSGDTDDTKFHRIQ